MKAEDVKAELARLQKVHDDLLSAARLASDDIQKILRRSVWALHLKLEGDEVKVTFLPTGIASATIPIPISRVDEFCKHLKDLAALGPEGKL